MTAGTGRALRLSAALIVRNEERFLPGCLESLRGCVDEIVVVDTGSTDRTPAIARAHGVVLDEFPWCDDFSAARNHALDRASGDWILFIDADERVRSCDRALVDPVLAAPGTWGALVTFHVQTGFTAARELRLFRRRPDVRFENAIHETVVPSINRVIGRDGGRIGITNLVIDHLGYDGGRAHKHERDLRLLHRQVVVDPDRTYLWWHLGSIHREKGDLAEAERAWLAGIEAARRSPRWVDENALCFIDLAKQRVLSGRHAEALALIDEVRRLEGNNPLLDYLEARCWAVLGRLDDALATFERLATTDADTLVGDFAYDKAIFGAGALAEAGLCLFRLGRHAEAAVWYGRAMALDPDNVALRAKHALAVARLRQNA